MSTNDQAVRPWLYRVFLVPLKRKGGLIIIELLLSDL